MVNSSPFLSLFCAATCLEKLPVLTVSTSTALAPKNHGSQQPLLPAGMFPQHPCKGAPKYVLNCHECGRKAALRAPPCCSYVKDVTEASARKDLPMAARLGGTGTAQGSGIHCHTEHSRQCISN